MDKNPNYICIFPLVILLFHVIKYFWWGQGTGPGPLLHLIKIELMASPVSRETTEQNAFCLAQEFQKLIELWIFEYLEVKNVVMIMSYIRLNFDNFWADKNRTFLPFLPSLFRMKICCWIQICNQKLFPVTLLPFLKKLVTPSYLLIIHK